MRHPFHALCPYFAMFPEAFVERQVRAYTSVGDATFDPFCGRGTTVFQSLLMKRPSGGTDVNSVAACIAGAKANPPELAEVVTRITSLEEQFDTAGKFDVVHISEFFDACFHPETLAQVLYLRDNLQWTECRVDRFVAAMALGALHGESHRSALYFSNRMPRTISTKPDYSVRWWRKNNSVAPKRNAFSILRRLARFRYRLEPAPLRGNVRQADAREAHSAFPEFAGKVRLVVTSPPYLDTTDYAEDQWLRLWFLGGLPHPVLRQGKDDRITQADAYWQFITEAWQGLKPLLASDATIVVRIGGKGLTKSDLFGGLSKTLGATMGERGVRPLDNGTTTAIKPRETTVFRTNSKSLSRVEHDFTFRIN